MLLLLFRIQPTVSSSMVKDSVNSFIFFSERGSSQVCLPKWVFLTLCMVRFLVRK